MIDEPALRAAEPLAYPRSTCTHSHTSLTLRTTLRTYGFSSSVRYAPTPAAMGGWGLICVPCVARPAGGGTNTEGLQQPRQPTEVQLVGRSVLVECHTHSLQSGAAWQSTGSRVSSGYIHDWHSGPPGLGREAPSPRPPVGWEQLRQSGLQHALRPAAGRRIGVQPAGAGQAWCIWQGWEYVFRANVPGGLDLAKGLCCKTPPQACSGGLNAKSIIARAGITPGAAERRCRRELLPPCPSKPLESRECRKRRLTSLQSTSVSTGIATVAEQRTVCICMNARSRCSPDLLRGSPCLSIDSSPAFQPLAPVQYSVPGCAPSPTTPRCCACLNWLERGGFYRRAFFSAHNPNMGRPRRRPSTWAKTSEA